MSTARCDPADGPQQLARQQAARLRRPRARRAARIDHVDVDREVDRVRAVERLGDGVIDDRLGAALLDLAHQVPAEALLAHPLERLDRRPVAAQPDLDEVATQHRARFDQPSHGCPVPGQHAPVVVGRVRMGIEVHDADAPRPPHLGDRGRRGPGDRMVTTEHDRDGARRRRPRGPCGRSARARGRSRPG